MLAVDEITLADHGALLRLTNLWVPDVSESSLEFLLTLLQITILTLKNHKLSCRGPFLVNQILLCSLGSVVFYKNMRCTVSSIFIG